MNILYYLEQDKKPSNVKSEKRIVRELLKEMLKSSSKDPDGWSQET